MKEKQIKTTKQTKETKPVITSSINDIIGYEEEKNRLATIINTLNNHKRLKSEGISIPKGLIIVSPSGCGKTFFAKVLLDSTKLNKVVINTQELDSNPTDTILNAFQKAKELKNTIIYLEQIEQLFNENPFTGQDSSSVLTLLNNQIDAISEEDCIFVLATTNTPKTLNKSICRSGRLDQVISLDYPDNNNRKKLLQKNFEKSKLTLKVKYGDLVSYTSNFNVADVIRFANECKRSAVLKCKNDIDEELVNTITNEIVMKSNSKNNNRKADNIIAYHEAGHAICSLALKKKVNSVSILRYNDALGSVVMGEESCGIRSKEDLFNQLVIMYGGRAAEIVKFNTPFTGSSDDVNRARSIAKEMVNYYGMYGYDLVTKFEQEFISDDRLKRQEKMISKVLSDAYNKAIEIITSYQECFENVHTKLMKEKTITGSEIKKMMLK